MRTINGSAVSVDYREYTPFPIRFQLTILDSHNGGAFSSGCAFLPLSNWMELIQAGLCGGQTYRRLMEDPLLTPRLDLMVSGQHRATMSLRMYVLAALAFLVFCLIITASQSMAIGGCNG